MPAQIHTLLADQHQLGYVLAVAAGRAEASWPQMA